MKREVEISRWVTGAGRAKGKIDELRQLNDYLNFWEKKVFAAQEELISKNLPVTSDAKKTCWWDNRFTRKPWLK
jgi:hypothetical protein